MKSSVIARLEVPATPGNAPLVVVITDTGHAYTVHIEGGLTSTGVDAAVFESTGPVPHASLKAAFAFAAHEAFLALTDY